MTGSLNDIRKAIKGMIVMSSDLDAMYTSFLNNQLPRIWERASFASLKSLGSWVVDLVFRVKFMRGWLVGGQPCAFPLPVFFFPQVRTVPQSGFFYILAHFLPGLHNSFWGCFLS
jgi:dynein heavy chain, axonemal